MKARRFLVREDDPTAVEFAMTLALIIEACLTIIKNLAISISGTFSSVNSWLVS
jgi:Flp pilus assembly pilin Flp